MSKLTAQELTSAAAQLDAEEAHVQAAIRSFATRMPPAALHEPRDERDLADEEVMRRQDDAMRDHYRMRLADIDAARARMQRGQYGICIDCGGAIPFLRLQAYPTAKRCTECQRRREHLYARDAERLFRGT